MAPVPVSGLRAPAGYRQRGRPRVSRCFGRISAWEPRKGDNLLVPGPPGHTRPAKQPQDSTAGCGPQTSRRCAGRDCLAFEKTPVELALSLGSKAQERSGTQTRALARVICKYRQCGTCLTTLPHLSVSHSQRGFRLFHLLL